MASVIGLNSDNRLLFSRPNGEQIIMQQVITAENNGDFLNNDKLTEYMSIETMASILNIGLPNVERQCNAFVATPTIN
eukprot:16431382-Heterocapsa_arctica.AAC.1